MSTKKPSRLENLKAAQAVGRGLSEDGAIVEAAREKANRTGTTRALEDIRPRPGGDTRPIDPGHVADLAESIAAVGLIEPVVIDRRGHLCAGSHRCAALRILAAPTGERGAVASSIFGVDVDAELVERLAALPENIVDGAAVPVAVLDFDAEREPTRALAVEVSENERRRDYSRSEIVALAERLKKAGFRKNVGRPRAGEKALVPALSLIVGKSSRTVERALAGEIPTNGGISGDPAAAAAVALGRAIGRYLKVARDSRRRAHQRLSAALRALAEDIEAASESSDAE
jgi:ParB family chromosome partitioning protein